MTGLLAGLGTGILVGYWIHGYLLLRDLRKGRLEQPRRKS